MASVVGVGCNQFGATCDVDLVARILSAVLDAGINFFDVADEYGPDGLSEEYLGRALGLRRDEALIATKFSSVIGNDPHSGGASRRWIERSVEASLRRLGTDILICTNSTSLDPER